VFSFYAANKKLMPFTEAAKVLNLGIAKYGFKKAEKRVIINVPKVFVTYVQKSIEEFVRTLSKEFLFVKTLYVTSFVERIMYNVWQANPSGGLEQPTVALQ